MLAGFLAIAGCADPEDPSPETPADDARASAPEAPAPNVLLVTLDTTRADRVGEYGYDDARTPVLDALAADGVRYDEAFCHVPLTLPSHATLMTGLLPATTGTRINGDPLVAAPGATLAEQFAERGYRTAAFVAAFPLDGVFGLERGFEVYDDTLGRDAVTGAERLERRADEVTDAALDWLDAEDDRPFFAWVHYYDPHWPYEPPPPYDTGNAYDGEIAYTDAQLGRLVRWLDTQGLRQETLVIVAGDHGEAFGEHGEVQHGLLLYEPTMRIPMLMSWPDRVAKGLVVDEPVGLVDVAPTIGALLGWPAREGLAGAAVPPAAGPATGVSGPSPRAVYGETESPRRAYGWAPLRSLTTPRWKYVEAPRPELYDRVADQGEEQNVIENHPETAATLATRLTDLATRSAAAIERSGTLDAATRRRLASLGYLGAGSDGSDDDDRPRRDPKDMVDVYREHAQAVAALQRGAFDEVVRRVEPLLERSPESDVLYATVGRAYLEVGRPEDAETAYEKSLRGDRTHTERLVGLAEARRRLGRFREAVDAYQEALVLEPELAEAHRGLGMVYAATGDLDRALEHCRSFADLAPSSPNAAVNLANVHLLRRELRPAVPLLEQALELDPSNRVAHATLWQALMQLGRRDDAVAALERAVATLPDRVQDFTCPLAWILATGPSGSRPADEVLELARRCRDADPAWPRGWDVLAAAAASAGDHEAAVEAATRGIALAEAAGDAALAAEMRPRLERYRAGQLWRVGADR